jgi:hypothetical protein
MRKQAWIETYCNEKYEITQDLIDRQFDAKYESSKKNWLRAIEDNDPIILVIYDNHIV